MKCFYLISKVYFRDLNKLNLVMLIWFKAQVNFRQWPSFPKSFFFLPRFSLNPWYTLQGSISPNFFCQAKICRRTACGEKFAIKFHQHSTSNCTKIRPVCELKFAQFVSKNSPNLCAIRQLPFATKGFDAKVGRNVDEQEQQRSK